jgi:cation diffusion facilitator family transporter
MKEKYRKRALLLSIATVGYNLVEGVAAVTVGLLTNSSALFSFGLDSFTESLSGSVMIWRFGKERSEEDEERIEQKAQKLVAYTFFILGAFVLYDAVSQLIAHEEPEKSLFGIVVAVLSLIIMPALTLAKYRTGKLLKSKSLIADSKQTLACVIMSATLLVGVGLNYFFGLWWADPVAAIAIAIMLFHEGKEALEGDEDEDAE